MLHKYLKEKQTLLRNQKNYHFCGEKCLWKYTNVAKITSYLWNLLRWLKDTVGKRNKLFVSQRNQCKKTHKNCKQFKLINLNLDLKSSKNNDIRIRLLKMLDKSKESMNLNKLVNEKQKIIDLKTDKWTMEQKSYVASIKLQKSQSLQTRFLRALRGLTLCNYVLHKDNYCVRARNGYLPKTTHKWERLVW